jgi:ATP-binding cassette subfamily B protein
MPDSSKSRPDVSGRRPKTPKTGLRDPQVRSGLGLLGRTLLSYRADSVRSIGGALLWMVFVVAIPYIIKLIFDDAIAADRPDLLVPLVTALLVAGLLQAIGIGARRYYGFRLSYRAEADLRNRMFVHMQRLGFGFHAETPTGQLMARSSSDLSQVRLVFAMLPITLANIGMLVAVAVVLVIIDPVLGAVSALMIPALFIAAGSYAKRVIDLSFDVQQRLGDLSQVVEEAVGGMQVVKAYGQEAQEQRRLDRAAARIYEKTIAMAARSATFGPLFELIPSIGTVAVLWIGGLRVVSGAITFGDFVAFTQYLSILVLPIRITGWFFANLPRAAAAATRVRTLLGTEPAPADPVDPISLEPGPGEVTFTDVRFGYPKAGTVTSAVTVTGSPVVVSSSQKTGSPGAGSSGAESRGAVSSPATGLTSEADLVLAGIDLTIPGGTAVARVGSPGAGKTTLAHRSPRFLDADSGSISIDGVEVRRIPLDQLRNEVAVVFQDTFLFSSSVRDNIALGAPDATDEQVRAAARLARAHDFICRLPDAYDTLVGERGLSLSGGQRQRVALARAVLRDPRILFLDDATCSVDAIVEAEIQAALRQVMAGRNTVIVAHRTSTLALVDQVVFLDRGRVAATGRHEDLLRTVPRYGAVLARVDRELEAP